MIDSHSTPPPSSTASTTTTTTTTTTSKFTLCGRFNTCCPVVSRLTNGNYTITDDYGGQVLLTSEQLLLMRDAIEHFNNNNNFY